MINYFFRIRKYLTFVMLIIILILSVYFRQSGYLNPEKILLFSKKINESTILAPFIFLLFFVLMVIFFIPTLPMNIGAGFIWGTFWGGVMALIGCAFGAAVSFVISRYLSRDYFNSKFNSPFWELIKNEANKGDWKVVAFTRANPIFPFGITSYIFGLSSISFFKFIVSTIIFIIPASFLFAYIGDIAGEIVINNELPDLTKKILIFSLLITITFIVWILLKKCRKRYIAFESEK